MDDEKKVYFTEEGLKAYKKKLDYKKTTESLEASEAIAVAREFGDLSENSEYKSARENQNLLEEEITRMQFEIDHAVIIKAQYVKFLNMKTHKELEFNIVGSTEAMFTEQGIQSISYISPIAQAVYGHKVGDVVRVSMANGMNYQAKILEVGEIKNN